MATHSFLLSGDLANYIDQLAGVETDLQQRLSQATAKLAEGGMKSSPEAMRLLSLLVKLTGTKRAIEVGTFTGYSALTIATALPEDGQLVCCDVSDEWTRIGRPFWEEAGVASRIDLRIGDAGATLQAMLDAGEAGRHDLAFIDADKAGYPAYYELCFSLLRPGGLMVFDNALRRGNVADPTAEADADLEAVRKVNRHAFDDGRVESAMLLLGDGLLLVRKR